MEKKIQASRKKSKFLKLKKKHIKKVIKVLIRSKYYFFEWIATGHHIPFKKQKWNC